jgi:dihydropteroate synthase
VRVHDAAASADAVATVAAVQRAREETRRDQPA